MGRVKSRMKRFAAVVLSLAVMVPVGVFGTSQTAKANGPTGAGLAAHAVTAYNEGWAYSYGSASPGAVDCSGLIYSYYGVGGIRSDMMAMSPQTGSIGTLPEIPGLGLYMPGHVGVYVGGGMCVDARDYAYGVCYQSVASMGWTNWFYVYGVNYGDATVTVDPSVGAGSSSNNSGGGADYVEDTPAEPVYLQLGSSGAEVAKLQQRLAELGYFNDGATEYFGEYTAECLKAFQAKAGYEATGILDPDTEALLYSDSAPSNLPAVYEGGEFAEEIHTIQQKLIQLQYMTGETTGFYGDQTKAAVAKFQTVVGLESTGVYDNTTRSKLEASDAPSNPEVAVIKKGDAGEEVTELQNRLILLRYMIGDASGTFDDATEAAVKEYQNTNSLEATGIVDKAMKDVLYSDKALRSPEADNLKLGYVGDDVKALQMKLAKLNLYQGDASGTFDKATEQAVKRFEEENGLRVTGVADLTVRIAIDAVINSLDLGPTYARNTDMTVQAAAITEIDEGASSNTTTSIVLGVLFGSLVLFGAVIVFYVKKNPYIVKVLRTRLSQLRGTK